MIGQYKTNIKEEKEEKNNKTYENNRLFSYNKELFAKLFTIDDVLQTSLFLLAFLISCLTHWTA